MDELVQESGGGIEARLARHGYRRTYAPSQRVFGFGEDLRIVLDQNPNHPTALYAAGLHFSRLAGQSEIVDRERLALAKDYLLKAVNVAQEDHRPFLGLSLVQSELGETEAAMKTIEDGLQAVEGNLPLLIRYAELRLEAGEFRKCDAILREIDVGLNREEVLEQSPLERRMLRQRGVHASVVRARWHLAASNPKGKKEQAAAIVVKIDPQVIVGENSRIILSWLGYCAISTGNLDKAIAAFSQCRGQRPQCHPPANSTCQAVSDFRAAARRNQRIHRLTQTEASPGIRGFGTDGIDDVAG